MQRSGGRRLRFFAWFAIGLAAVITLAGAVFGDRQIVYNDSPSVPVGWYIRTGKDPVVGEIVDFPIPESVRPYVEGRTGPYEGWYILKPIVAAEGDHVSTAGGRLTINGAVVAEIVSADAEGKPVPTWSGSRRLEAGELFVLSTRIARSFDSRIYGPIRAADITGVYRKFW